MKEKKDKILFIIIFAILVIITIISIIILSKNFNISNTIQNEQKDMKNIYANDEIDTIITAKSIANAKNKSEYYGKIVTGYDCTNSAGVNAWKLFYADENNIYLIADDYISYNYCPSSATQKINTTHTDYELAMKNVINDYKGSVDITDEKIKALNNDYFNEHNYISDNNSMKAVAYMLDTNVWSVYAGEKAEYAVGGPSIEIMLKSYSQKYGVDYRAKADNFGYRISNDGGATWDTESSNMLERNDSLYVIKSPSKALHVWLASPSCYAAYDIMYVGHLGYLGFDSVHWGGGFRPLVCLKSDVSLERQEDGTYMIK